MLSRARKLKERKNVLLQRCRVKRLHRSHHSDAHDSTGQRWDGWNDAPVKVVVNWNLWTADGTDCVSQ